MEIREIGFGLWSTKHCVDLLPPPSTLGGLVAVSVETRFKIKMRFVSLTRTVEKAAEEQIRARVTVHDRDGIIRAVTWMQPLLGKWTERLRGYHKIGETAAMPGAKLAALVTRHMKIEFAQHRRMLTGG